ncbi:MAG TPA: iron donor protein CyaY [Blastocatellia bacterium]|jgi:CyaY protein
MSDLLSEYDFQQKAEAAIGALEAAFGSLAEDRDIDVELQGGVLTISFEEGEPGKFVVSPNSSARQIWVSARVSSYKFDWSTESGSFVLHSSGELLKDVMARLTREQLGDAEISF